LWTAICPISGSGLSPALSAFLPFQSLVTECSCRDQLLAPLPSSCGLKAPHPLCHVFLFSPLFIIQFFFFSGPRVSLSRGLCCFIPGGLWEYCLLLICSPVGLPNVSQAGLELVFGGTGALLFYLCNMVWRNSVWDGGSGCRSPDSSWCFFLPSVAPASQQGF
jgi:hypothetical protein